MLIELGDSWFITKAILVAIPNTNQFSIVHYLKRCCSEWKWYSYGMSERSC